MGGLSYRSSVKDWAAKNQAVKALLARDSHLSLEHLAQRFNENGESLSQTDLNNMQATLQQLVQFGNNLSILREETHRQSLVAHKIQLEQGVTERNETIKHNYEKLNQFLEIIDQELERLSNDFLSKMEAETLTPDDLSQLKLDFDKLALEVEAAEKRDLSFIPNPEPRPESEISPEKIEAQRQTETRAMEGLVSQLKLGLERSQRLGEPNNAEVEFADSNDITSIPENIVVAQSMGITMTALQRFVSVLSLSPSDNIAMNLYHKDIDATEASHVAHRMAAGRWGTDPDPRFLDPNSPIDTADELAVYGKNMSSNPNYIPTSLKPPTRLTPDDPQ